MNANALQQAVDEIAFEYDPLKFDGKTGSWKLNGFAIAADTKIIVIVPTAKHYGILFDAEGRKIDWTDAIRYVVAKPTREYATRNWKPSTSVTGIIFDESKRLVTISMLTWSGETPSPASYRRSWRGTCGNILFANSVRSQSGKIRTTISRPSSP
jgi:hypothetical protein